MSDPRTDPVGTVRRHDDRTVVKISMGDNSGKGGHVWSRMDDDLSTWFYHHAEIQKWEVTDTPAPHGYVDELTHQRDQLRERYDAAFDGRAALQSAVSRFLIDARIPNTHLRTMEEALQIAAREVAQLRARSAAAEAELEKWDALATRESAWLPCRAGLAALRGGQSTEPVQHIVEVNDEGEEFDCLDDCPACLAEPERTYVYRPGAVDMRTTSDCLRACLATVTGRPYEDAPDDEGDWRGKAVAFLNANDARSSNLVIGIGESPRGCKGGHAIVCNRDGTPVHDPHPSRAGVLEMRELWDADGQVVIDEPEFGRHRAVDATSEERV